jgi:hypothetical protein
MYFKWFQIGEDWTSCFQINESGKDFRENSYGILFW